MLESTIDSLPLEDELAITFAGAVCFGIYVVSFIQCLRWQLFPEGFCAPAWKQRKAMAGLIVLVGVLTTTYVAFGYVKSKNLTYNALHGISIPSGVYPWHTTALCTTGNSTVLIVDTVVIYRCWLVCGRSKRILIFPSIMWLAGLVCTVLQLYGETVPTGVLGEGKWQPVNMEIGPGTVLTPFWASTILLNTYTMCLVMHRIWKAAKTTVGSGAADLFHFALYALAESGFLYFTTTLAHFIVWWTPSGLAIRLANATNIPAVGIAFNLILIRAGQNRTHRLRRETDDKISVAAICVAEIEDIIV